MKKKLPLVSIIVPAYRAGYFINNEIKNLSEIRYPSLEVIMIFDPSDGMDVEVAQKKTQKKKNWRIIANKKHLGISKSLNLGIKESKGKYVIFLMTDMIVDSGCILELVNFIEKSSEPLAGVAAKTYDYHKRNVIQAYSMYFMPQTGFLYIPEYGLKDQKKYNEPFEGFCGIDGVLFKKEVFKSAGLFDLDIDSGINDLDMIWRIWLSGYKIIRIPSAKVYHWSLKEGRATDKWEFSYARMVDVFIQNYSLKYLIIYLPQLLAVFTFRAMITFFQGNPNPLKGWLKSLIWSVSYLPKALEKRKIIQTEIRKVPDEYLSEKIFGKMSLWDFYKHLKWVQTNITPKLLTQESKNDKILTFSK